MDLFYLYLISFGSLLLSQGECGEWECKTPDDQKKSKAITAPIPVNRPCSVAAEEERPNLKCWVGIESVEVDNVKLTDCNLAKNITIFIPYGELRKKFKNVREKRFGIQDNGEEWPNPITDWVCSSVPHKGTITKDCLPRNHAPGWYSTPIAGPAPGARMRKPGCNGMVCYCNKKDGCNGSLVNLPGLLPAILSALLLIKTFHKL